MRLISFFVLTILLTGCNNKPPSDKSPAAAELLSGEYWKNQALKDIMPYWTKYSRDTISGAFFTNLDSLWKPFGSQDKYPSMISRHLFSYSAAYLLSGNENDLLIADRTVKWLLDHAWDKEYGGWYDALDKEGNPIQTTKSTFVQVYTITGLVMYYVVTHDSTILEYIEKSNDLLEMKVWGKTTGGYYNAMNRDWSISDSNKSFSSEITPVSGYLIYLYLATREKKYLDQVDRILRITTKNMIDDESGWILEDFDPGWRYIPRKPDETEINIGHNIEGAWMLIRNYLLTGNEDLLKTGQLLVNKILKAGVFNMNNIWLSTSGRTNASLHSTGTYWWIQAYGNMFSLYQYHITKDQSFLDNFVKGATLWDNSFMDREYGDTYFSTDSAGKVTEATKATRFKASYHNMEQCILNYLCLNLWVNNEPAELHFRINSLYDGEVLYPVLIEDKSIKISSVTGKSQDQRSLKIEDQGIRLPKLKTYTLKVILTKKGN
jgi:mannobiose 2-epimerase